MFKKLFCSHDYIEVKHFVVKSKFDVIKEGGYVPNTWSSTTRIYVTDYKCPKCKKLKRETIKTSL